MLSKWFLPKLASFIYIVTRADGAGVLHLVPLDAAGIKAGPGKRRIAVQGVGKKAVEQGKTLEGGKPSDSLVRKKERGLYGMESTTGTGEGGYPVLKKLLPPKYPELSKEELEKRKESEGWGPRPKAKSEEKPKISYVDFLELVADEANKRKEADRIAELQSWFGGGYDPVMREILNERLDREDALKKKTLTAR